MEGKKKRGRKEKSPPQSDLSSYYTMHTAVASLRGGGEENAREKGGGGRRGKGKKKEKEKKKRLCEAGGPLFVFSLSTQLRSDMKATGKKKGSEKGVPRISLPFLRRVTLGGRGEKRGRNRKGGGGGKKKERKGREAIKCGHRPRTI